VLEGDVHVHAGGLRGAQVDVGVVRRGERDVPRDDDPGVSDAEIGEAPVGEDPGAGVADA
jgi:hypothetical protein